MNPFGPTEYACVNCLAVMYCLGGPPASMICDNCHSRIHCSGNCGRVIPDLGAAQQYCPACTRYQRVVPLRGDEVTRILMADTVEGAEP